MIVNIFYVVYRYPLALLMLSRRLRRCWMDLASKPIIHHLGWRDELQTRLRNGLRSALMDVPGGRAVLLVPAALGITVWRAGPISFLLKTVAYGVWTLLSSEMFSFVEVTIWFGLGIVSLLQDRASGHSLAQDSDDPTLGENEWGFGQLVPWLLLFLPVMQFFESYATYSYDAACPRELKELSDLKGGESREVGSVSV